MSTIGAVRGSRNVRAVAKACSWRVVGAIDTFILAWILVGELHTAGAIMGLEAITKVVWYVLHERVWEVLWQ